MKPAIALALLAASAQAQISFEPEDAASEPAAVAPRPPEREPARVTVRARTRGALDAAFQDGEDIFDQRTRLDLSYQQRLSAAIGVKLAAVARHFVLAHRPAPGKLTSKADLELDVGEAWLDLALGPVDLRLGNQIFSWGAARDFAPDDVLNPIDARDDAFFAPEDKKLPVLAASARALAGPVQLELALVPFFRPHKMNLYGQDWSLAGRGGAIPAPGGGLLDASVEDAAQPLLLGTEQPQEGLSPPSAGLRAEWTALRGEWTGGLEREVKVALAYYDGYDRLPRLEIDPDLVEVLAAQAARREPDLVSALRLADKLDRGVAVWRASYGRMRLFGAEASALLGPVTVSLDAAYVPRKRFYTDTFQSVRRRSWNITGSATWERDEMVLSAGASTMLVGDLAAGERLFLLDKSGDGAVARDWALFPYLTLGGGMGFFGGDLRVGGGLVAGLHRGDRAALARVQMTLGDAWTVAAGGQALWGPPDSPVGFYGDNDAVYVEIGYLIAP